MEFEIGKEVAELTHQSEILAQHDEVLRRTINQHADCINNTNACVFGLAMGCLAIIGAGFLEARSLRKRLSRVEDHIESKSVEDLT